MCLVELIFEFKSAPTFQGRGYRAFKMIMSPMKIFLATIKEFVYISVFFNHDERITFKYSSDLAGID